MKKPKISDFFMHYLKIYVINKQKNYVLLVFQLFKN